jgi:hypothetical protein
MNFKKLLPHLIVLIGFVVLVLSFVSPVLSGKTLRQHDAVQGAGSYREVVQYHEKTGEWPWWTNSMFGGMPAYFVGGHHEGSIFTKIGHNYNPLPGGNVGNLLLWCLIGAYILFVSLKMDYWLAVLGAIGYAFATLNILWIEAGHAFKVYSLAFAPMMIAGVLLAFKDKKMIGALLFAFALGLEINANHPQINYYTVIGLGIIVAIEIVKAIRNKEIKNIIYSLIFIGAGGVLGVAGNSSKLWTTYEYSKASTRSKSELTAKNTISGGLDRDYAFSGSLAPLETFTFLIPRFMGGASSGEFNIKSETFQKLSGMTEQITDPRQIPSYWGDQGIMTGSLYAGAIVIFLFILGLFVAENRFKLSFTIISIFFLLLSWGKNVPVFSDLMFDYFPMYNKFRDVKMILSLQQLFMIGVGVFGIKTIIDKQLTWDAIKKKFFITLGLTAGICLIFALIPSLFLSFTNENESQMNIQILQVIQEGRESLLKADAWRSIFFILLAAATVWAFVTNKIKTNVLMIALAVLLTLDLYLVDKRYLNKDEFVPKITSSTELFQATPADTEILTDKSLGYRVVDLTGGIFSDARPSFFHKSIGGYHGAKMRHYQEVVDNHLGKQVDDFIKELQKENQTLDAINIAMGKQKILNMFNTKYIIVNPEGKPLVNNYALGSAWFVDNPKIVANADEEMKELGTFDPQKTVLIDKRYEEFVKDKNMQADTSAKIKMTEYEPNKLVYEYDSKTEQVAVFSEVYYNGNKDWISTVNGKETPHFRANYLFRAMVIPAGKHKVEFKFAPPAIATGYKIDVAASILLILGLIGVVFMEFRKSKNDKSD